MADQKILFEEESIDFKKWLLVFLKNWKFFATGIIGALLLALFFTMLTDRNYQLVVKILVKNEENPLDKAELFTSNFLGNPYQIENEKGILKAKSITRTALELLDFNIAYYKAQGFHVEEIYQQSPFVVIPDINQTQPLLVNFNLIGINDSLVYVFAKYDEVIAYSYQQEKRFSINGKFQFSDTIKYGEIVGNEYCRFKILKTGLNKILPGDKYAFRFFDINELMAEFRSFKIENDKSSSILTITLNHKNPKKAAMFLNALADVYLNKGVDRNNRIAEATIRFIDSQLIDIVDSLYTSGERLQNFKSSNKILDIGFQAEKVYTRLEDLEAQKAKLLVKQRYFNYLTTNLKSKSDVTDLIAPTTLDINDPVLNKLIFELAELYSDRSEMSFNAIKNNPYQNTLDSKIDETRTSLINAANSILESTNLGIEEIKLQIDEAENLLLKLPQDQQRLISIERKFKLNDELYTYLLTRRSEMEIFKASNIPANEVLDAAAAEDAILISPKLQLNLAMAIFLGFVFPGLWLYFRETINNRIRTIEDIKKLTALPIVGEIIGVKNAALPCIINEPNSILSETYRTLRTNLQFVIDENKPNVILVTSAIQGEGKSFTAINLASVYASYGKKVILLDFDLRKSRIQSNLKLEGQSGISNYLSNQAVIEDIKVQAEWLNFQLILAGPVPPNPSELVASARTSDLIQSLKAEYNIIIIDSPPIGVVSDALLIYPHADKVLLVTRQNYTTFEIFQNVISSLNARKIDQVNIILNAVEVSRSRYGYGYHYGYHQGYGETAVKLAKKNLLIKKSLKRTVNRDIG